MFITITILRNQNGKSLLLTLKKLHYLVHLKEEIMLNVLYLCSNIGGIQLFVGIHLSSEICGL